MTREALHELIDRLPEGEIFAAQRLLEHLATSAPFRAAYSAPLDDEPETEEEEATVASSLADASPDIPFDQLRRKRA